MNIPNPPNTKAAYKEIKKYPKFNEMPYYQFSDLYFNDFEMIIITDSGKQSYKSYLYETLLYHLICLGDQKNSDKETDNLLLGSILKETKLYKFTEYKETLENIFQVKSTE
jgi:hypothetical protein